MYLPTLLVPTPSTFTIPLQITTYPLLPGSYPLPPLPCAQPPPAPPSAELAQSEAQPVKVEEVEEGLS